jgi:LCP family protein required for cell wall assembly
MRTKRRKKRLRWHVGWKCAAAAALLWAVAGVVSPARLSPDGGNPMLPAKAPPSDALMFLNTPPPVTMMLLGIDSRSGEASRSDAILIARLNPKLQTVRLLSVPRDTRVLVPGYGYTKINHAMAYGGVPLLRRTIETFLHIPIHFYAVVDFTGFQEIVDTLGGVVIDVEKQMDYDDPSDGTHIHLHPGPQLLNGRQALGYVRFRHDAEADRGRMRRQQALLRAISQKAWMPRQWANVFPIISRLGRHVETDMPRLMMARLALFYYRISPDAVQTFSLAGQNRIDPSDQIWYFYADEPAKDEAVRQLMETGPVDHVK